MHGFITILRKITVEFSVDALLQSRQVALIQSCHGKHLAIADDTVVQAVVSNLVHGTMRSFKFRHIAIHNLEGRHNRLVDFRYFSPSLVFARRRGERLTQCKWATDYLE